MWCRSCGIETNEYKCPVCGKKTEEEIPVEIYWCDSCKTPIIKQISDSYKDKCPCCGRKTKYMAKDIRPVFPEERLLMEIDCSDLFGGNSERERIMIFEIGQ